MSLLLLLCFVLFVHSKFTWCDIFTLSLFVCVCVCVVCKFIRFFYMFYSGVDWIGLDWIGFGCCCQWQCFGDLENFFFVCCCWCFTHTHTDIKMSRSFFFVWPKYSDFLQIDESMDQWIKNEQIQWKSNLRRKNKRIWK